MLKEFTPGDYGAYQGVEEAPGQPALITEKDDHEIIVDTNGIGIYFLGDEFYAYFFGCNYEAAKMIAILLEGRYTITKNLLEELNFFKI